MFKKKEKVTKVKKVRRQSEHKLFKNRKKMIVEKPKTNSDIIRCLFKGYDKSNSIFKIADKRYTVVFEYTDISFAKAQREEQYSIITKWIAYLNSTSEHTHIEVVNIGRPVQQSDFKKNYMYDDKNEDLTENEKRIAREMNILIERAITSDSDKQETKRLLVLSQECESYEEAKAIFTDIEMRNKEKFKEFKSDIRRLSIDEVLEITHDFFNSEKRDTSIPLNLTEKTCEEFSIFDLVAPKKPVNFSKRNYFSIGDRFYRILYLSHLPNSMTPSFYNKLTTTDMDIITTLNIQPLNNAKVIKQVEQKISGIKTERLDKIKKANQKGYTYEAVMDEKLEDKLKDYQQLKNDLQRNGQKMFQNNLLVCIMGDSLDDINKKTNRIFELAGESLIEFSALNSQQLEGIVNILPFGHNTLQIVRNLSSEATAVNVPFNTKDLSYPNSIFFGLNLISRNAIFADRKKLINGNGCVLATSGAGKSFSVKTMLEQIKIRYPKDNIIIIDPQSEYDDLIDALNGQMIEISPTASTYINPFDLDLNYDDKEPVKAKTEYIIAFVESLVDGNLNGAYKTIIDRCTKIAFEPYEESGFKDKSLLPDLPTFYELIKQQPEREASELALVIERFVQGSLDIFARKTNVNIQNQVVCFDISKLSSSMQTTGYLVVLDYVMNLLASNKKEGIGTWIVIDEFHILLANQYSAEYIAKIYKVGRKFFAFPTIITQNIADVLANEQGRKILSNSEFALILKQKPLDLPELQAIFDISNSEAEYVIDSQPGQGILYFQGDKVIFKNEVPKDFYIYKLNQTSMKTEENKSKEK